MYLKDNSVSPAPQAPTQSTGRAVRQPSPQKHTRSFIRGPIDCEWLRRANELGGSEGKVAVALFYFKGVNKSDRFKLTGRIDELAAVCRQTRQRALLRLAEAGLIRLKQSTCAFPTVEVLLPSDGPTRTPAVGRALSRATGNTQPWE